MKNSRNSVSRLSPVIIVILLSLSVAVFAQKQINIPECGALIAAEYGASNLNERGYCLAPASENNAFYVGGYADSAILITKMGLDGNVQWSRSIEPPAGRLEHINSMFLDTDGMLVISGNAPQGEQALTATFALRYDPLLDVILWHKIYTNASHIRNNSIIQKETGGDYIVANTTLFSNTSENIEILTLEKLTGNVITTFSINNDPSDSWENLADLYLDSNFIYGTGRITVGFNNRRSILLKYSTSDGALSWSNAGHMSPDDRADFAGADIIMFNNEIYSLYYGTVNDIDVSKLYIRKTNTEGELIWLKQYELPGAEDGGFEMIVSENGVVILGFKRAPSEVVLFKIDTTGNVLWAYQFDVALGHTLAKVVIYKSSQLIQVGANLIFTTHVTDALDSENLIVVKTDLNGRSQTPCITSKAIIVNPVSVPNPHIYSLLLNVDKSFKEEAVASLETSEYTLAPAELCVFIDTIFTTIGASICTGELFEGYEMTGTYTDTFLLESGCDSIRTLNLMVIDPVMFEINRTICAGSSFEGYSVSGTFNDTIAGISGCDSIRTINLMVIDPVPFVITKTICAGSSFEGYSVSGTFNDTFPAISGCDSIRTLHLSVISCEPIVYYNLDACQAYMHNGTNMDYTEFIPAYPNSLVCADISANYLFRSPPQENKHSCTPGVNNSIAMCVSAMPSCTYVAGHEASVVIELQVNPHPDSIVKITSIELFEKAPLTYSWIDGGSGPNNYPLKYGIRILKNGTEIFRNESVATNLNWTLQSYDFINNDLFIADTNTLFRIELLPYCLVGNGAEVAAWDLDDVRIFGGCMPVNNSIIQGSILTKNDLPVKNVDVHLSTTDAFTNQETKITEANGSYLFDDLEQNQPYYVKAYKNDDVLNGVSTLDLVYLQRHLLGIEPFQSLHDYVAADANRSESVNVADIIDLRKTILGIITQFPRNTSWRFGILPQDFTITNLFSFRELNKIPSLWQDTLVSDFVGIKIGDLNGDVQLDAWEPQIEKRSFGEFALLMDNNKFSAGEPLSIDIRSEQDLSIAGFQFAVSLKDLDFITLKPGVIDVSAENAFLSPDGTLRISWSQAEALKISKDEVLFTLIVDPSLHGTLKEKIELVRHLLQPEAYDGANLDVLKIILSIRDIKDLKEQASFAVEPNPFQSSFNIRLNLPNSGRTVVTFYDLSGRILHQIDKHFPAGETLEKVLDQKRFPKEGIIYCQLVSNGFTSIQKLVKVE